MQIPDPNQHSSSNTVNLEDNSNTNKTEHGNSTINGSETLINNDNITINNEEEDYNNKTNKTEHGNSAINNSKILINNNNITITSEEEGYSTNNDIKQEECSNCELVIYKVQGDYSGIVCKIIEKSYESNKRCLLLCKDEEEVELLDSKLWTYSKLSFIPHGSKYSLSMDDAIHCNTWISEELVYINNPDYLINLGCLINDNIKYNFTKIIDITCNEHDSISTIKNKYNINFNKCTLWTYYNNKWIKSN